MITVFLLLLILLILFGGLAVFVAKAFVLAMAVIVLVGLCSALWPR